MVSDHDREHLDGKPGPPRQDRREDLMPEDLRCPVLEHSLEARGRLPPVVDPGCPDRDLFQPRKERSRQPQYRHAHSPRTAAQVYELRQSRGRYGHRATGRSTWPGSLAHRLPDRREDPTTETAMSTKPFGLEPQRIDRPELIKPEAIPDLLDAFDLEDAPLADHRHCFNAYPGELTPHLCQEAFPSDLDLVRKREHDEARPSTLARRNRAERHPSQEDWACADRKHLAA